MTAKNMSVSLRVLLQGSATKEFAQQLKTLRGETLAFANVATKANSEVVKLANGLKEAIVAGKALTSTFAQLTGQSTLLGGRSRTLASDINVVNASLQQGARDAQRMREELNRLGGARPPVPPNGGGGGRGSGNPPPHPHQGINTTLNAGAVGLATGLAAYVTSKDKVNEAIGYSSQLMSMANTAYYDKDLAGRITGKHELAGATLAAIRQGGGSRDDATLALNDMIASGIYSPQEAMDLLPTVQMTVTGTRASSKDLAAIGTKGGLFGFKNTKEDYEKIIDMGNLSGKLGGFELKDMAPWLPRQMGAASLSGMRGDKDFAILLAANQMAMKVAGSSDEAGNNVQNLLFKLNGQDTANDFKKMGVDLRGWLANVQKSGQNPMIAYTELIQKQLEKDPRYQKLQAEIKDSKTDAERKDKAEKAAEVLKGGIVGTIFQDREALKGMIALVSLKDEWLKQANIVETQYKGTSAKDAQANMQESDFKIQAFKNEWQAAADRVFTPVANALGSVAGVTADVLKKNEGLGNALVISSSALLIMAAAATVASMAFGKQAVIGAVTSFAGSIYAAAKALPIFRAALAYGVWEAGQWVGDKIYKEYYENTPYGDFLGEQMAKLVALVPERFGGQDAREALNPELTRPKKEVSLEDKNTIENVISRLGQLPIQVQNIIHLDGQELSNYVETKVVRQAQRQ